MQKAKLMTHIVAGYPTLAESEKLAYAMAKNGASFIEIQFPFSDPIADGNTIMEANQKALQNDITTQDCFDLFVKLKRKIKIPLLIMTYYNIAFRYGLEKFCKKASQIGSYGLIIPDIPIDEEKYESYLFLSKKYNLNPIQIISPLTSISRLKKISKVAKGFVYCVSSFGTTGEKKELNKNLKTYLSRVRKYIKIPIALGFGVSSREHVEQLKNEVDIIVIGSKILNVYNNSEKDKGIQNVASFLKSLGFAQNI
jgi:tryptophan synthase alpha subunit